MSSAFPGDDPVVEPSPDGEGTDLTVRALRQRIRQQELLAELGVTALQGAKLDELLEHTARLTAQGLRAEFCKVLEHIRDENRLLVRAGVGWGPGVVGKASIGADLASPAGFALRTGKPVISNHLENEERFETPPLLAEHGVRRAMNVILQGDGKPFGVLEVDSRSEDDFVEHDLTFLQGAANILGMAIERERYERKLEAALDRHKILLAEVNHRVKNSLAMVASMLRLQAANIGNAELTEHLDEASHRVLAIARAHERLYQSTDIERLDLGVYVGQVCKDLDEAVARCEIVMDAEPGISMSIDRAIPAALIVAELVTNAAKYAYRSETGGKVWVRVARGPDRRITLSVRDEGNGLPLGFDIEKAKGLGMRIIVALSQQLEAELSTAERAPGVEFIVSVPVETGR